MCGIGGIYSFSKAPVDGGRLERMSAALAHRGPDGQGVFSGEGFALIHRRLAIIDLTERAAQPSVHLPSGSALSFNGEIYNYRELREALVSKGERFRSDGDAEVLLAGLVKHGRSFLSRVDGDFAFAFWNSAAKKLVLCRDRFGIKPLYFYRAPTEVIFSSEIRGLLAAGVSARPNLKVFHEYLRFRYSQDAETIFDGVRSVRPGEWIEISGAGMTQERYWSINPARFEYRTTEEGLEKLREIWERSVRGRLVSDVELGLLLSGGIDSGFIAATARDLGSSSLHAATYEVPGSLSEVARSQEIARALGYRQSVVAHSDDQLASLERVIRAIEEPLADSILIPTYRLFEESRRHMKVVLSGEGADEVFGGYAHQNLLKKFLAFRNSVPESALPWVSTLLNRVPLSVFSAALGYPARLGEEARVRGQALLRADDVSSAHDLTRSLMSDAEASALLSKEARDSVAGESGRPAPREATWRSPKEAWAEILQKDLAGWLPNYGLTRVDKLSMAHGLECRVPYLHHEFAEAALAMTLREGQGLFSEKAVLRKLVRKSAHAALFADRKKQPFFLSPEGVEGQAFDRACDAFLSHSQLKKWGIFDVKAIQHMRSQGGGFIQNKKTVAVLHLQAWCEAFL